MSRIRFLASNLASVPATVLTASSAASGLPVTAAINPDRTFVWRSAAAVTGQTIDLDLGSPQAVSAIAVANVKLIGTGVLELYHRGNAETPGTPELVATLPTQDPDRRLAFVFFAELTHRHWRLQWTNPTAVSDYAEVGYLYLGTYLEPSVNISVPFDVAAVDPSIPGESLDGQATFTSRTNYAGGAFQFRDIAEADLTSLRALRRTVGVRTPFVMVLDEALAWTAWLARFASELRIGFGELAGRYHVSFDWKEAR